MAGQEVEPVVQELAKNDLGRPMPNFASRGLSSRGSGRIVVPSDCGDSTSDAMTCICAKWSAHQMLGSESAFPNHTPAVP